MSRLTPKIGKVATHELARRGFINYDQLALVTTRRLLAIRGIGPRTIRILKYELDNRGSAFVDEWKPHSL